MNIEFCCNYVEEDPISFELIKDLPQHNTFFITCPITNKFYAYDAVAWATYFITHSTSKNPCTMTTINPVDMWSCYETARRYLPINLQKKFKSWDIYLKKISPKFLRLHTISPLYTIQVIDVQITQCDTDITKHVCLVVYIVCNSQTKAKIPHITKLRKEFCIQAGTSIQIV